MGSLRARLALIVAGAVAATVVVSGVALFNLVAGDEQAILDEELGRQAERLMQRGVFRELVETQSPQPPGAIGQGEPLQSPLPQGDVSLPPIPHRITVDGEVISQTEPFSGADSPGVEDLGSRTVDLDGQSWRVLTADLADVGPPAAASDPAVLNSDVVVEVAASYEPTEESITSLRNRIVVFGVAAVLVGGVAGWLLAGVGLRPLTRLRQAAGRVASSKDLATRVPAADMPEEVGGVASSLNDMLARLERSARETDAAHAAAEGFARNVGHEIRTPLTSMSANIDALLRNPDIDPVERAEILHDIQVEQQRLTAILGALETLARGDLADQGLKQDTDVLEIVDASVFALGRRYPDSPVEVDVHGDPRPVNGWPEGLRVMIDNLLKNAAVHGRRNGRPARIGVWVVFEPSAAVIAVEDSGPGIPEHDRVRVTKPFERGDTATDRGSGLGLALAAQQAEFHHGTLEIGEAPGGGTRVSVTLPCEPTAGTGPGGRSSRQSSGEQPRS